MESWFDRARFGLFVHWGHSSQQGIELSWPLVGGIPLLPQCTATGVEEYHSSAATFDPQRYDPREWARLARRLGMTYAVLTAKHHDGYAMFDTNYSDYSVMHSPYGRDIVRGFVEAMREEGLRVGLYFSLIDWRHPDYPAFAESDKPYVFGRWRQPSPEGWARYLEFMFGQLRELLTNYGRIDILWFDGGWERTPEQWRARELHDLIRELQPDTLVNDRLPGFGDFSTPEQFIPAQPPGRRWEVCLTMNDSWGYNASDRNFKTPRQLIHTLCEVAGKGGNLLLNVSPMGDGRLPPEIVERLAVMAAWMSRHGESIVGTDAGLEPWQFYGPSTRRSGRVYLHLLSRPYETVSLRGVPIRRLKSVRALSNRAELQFTTRCALLDQALNADPSGELTISVPEEVLDPYATVLAVDFADAPLPPPAP